MSHLLSDYTYHLPPDLIASRPLKDRDASRMMVVNRSTGEITHAAFRDFPSLIREGDLVVLNDSKVIKARLISEDSKIEIFLLEPREPRVWTCMSKPGRKTRIGAVIPIAGTIARVEDVLPGGERVVVFEKEPDWRTFGEMPVPPYFKRHADGEDDSRYQTVYAREEGSVAAPTAGLHFTPEVLQRIPHTFLTLHVGAGTFLPVKVEDVREHVMHEERYSISADSAQKLNAASRIVAVGTTVTRVLEAQPGGSIHPAAGRTDIFIYPPFEFQHVDSLLTNFHLPNSTLLMLVSALAGRDLILEAYAKAVESRYRFFSYGDCMLIL